jgi:hydroxymethylbilane synthase
LALQQSPTKSLCSIKQLFLVSNFFIVFPSVIQAVKKIRLGTRSSQLARWQAEWTAAQLRQLGIQVEIVFIATQGDQLAGSLQNSTERGLFTKRIQQSLLADEIDLAVHSLKDLPTDPIPGLALAAVPRRELPDDVLVSRDHVSLVDLPRGAHVGTGSWRRQSQLLNFRDDLQVRDIRGNVDTRLKKLDQGEYDAIVLAYAGLHRLGLAERITEKLPYQILLPAVGQGALGLETRTDDTATRECVAQLNDADTWASVTAERAMLFTIGGGCLAPVGAAATVTDGRVALQARVLSQQGTERIDHSDDADMAEAQGLGEQVAEALNRLGAQSLLAAARQH